MNVDRLICGLATPFDETSVDGELRWGREHFETFVELETALPLKVDHAGLITTSRVVPDIGRAIRFAFLGPGHDPVPAGLLILAELDETPIAGAFLDAIRDGLRDPWARGSLTGLSLRALVVSDPEMAWPEELSITRSPRFDSARICAAGEAALNAWQLLTGQQVAA